MQYGFVIDNRKCIGCHACTTACKSEHDVPIGVNRTWVKQVEKGIFPQTRRLFSVMRCNHCTDAPCVEICPVEALFFREDGIVDFDKQRCIGCKSCMQACPYDALYIDPETKTAAKCNYCAHRIDMGLEPACVNVCPEEAIISGDLDDPDSKIARLIATEPVTARKIEKGTAPNLFYIDGDEAILDPMRSEPADAYMWNAQSSGVGHFARAAEKLSFSNDDIVESLLVKQDRPEPGAPLPKTVEVLMGKDQRVYDAPNKGILWGWEVTGYVFTKAIAAGIFLTAALGQVFGNTFSTTHVAVIAAVFLLLTGVLLVKDLDQPGRFLYVLLRPQWKSWLTKGGYAIAFYGLALALWFIGDIAGSQPLENIGLVMGIFFGLVTAIYTAFLFRQARGRELWQSHLLLGHMLIQSLTAGLAALVLLDFFMGVDVPNLYLIYGLLVCLLVNALTLALEILPKHDSVELQRTMRSITHGRYRKKFWFGGIFCGIVAPAVLLISSAGNMSIAALAAVFVLIGIFITEHIWVESPQRISLI